MKPRTYYSADQWKAWILEWKASGMQIKGWCNLKGLDCTVFYRWRRKFIDKGELNPNTFEDMGTEKCNDSDAHAPAVVQINLSDLDQKIDHLPDSSSRAPVSECVLSSQLVIEAPISGYRVYVGNDFSQETLKRIMEVLR